MQNDMINLFRYILGCSYSWFWAHQEKEDTIIYDHIVIVHMAEGYYLYNQKQTYTCAYSPSL